MKVVEGTFGKQPEAGYTLEWIQEHVRKNAEHMRDTMGVDISRGTSLQIYIFGDHMVFFTTPDLSIPEAVYMCEKSKDAMLKGYV